MRKRIHGFLHEAVIEINSRPGQSAWEIVERLVQSGRAQSAADNPHPSLEGTLHKHYMLHGIERRKEGGVYRFYPIGASRPPAPPRPIPEPSEEDEDIVATLRISRRISDVADALVAAGKYQNRAAALTWLVEKGISSLRV